MKQENITKDWHEFPCKTCLVFPICLHSEYFNPQYPLISYTALRLHCTILDGFIDEYVTELDQKYIRENVLNHFTKHLQGKSNDNRR